MTAVPRGATSLADLPLATLQAIRRELGPEFASEKQADFFYSTTPELLYSGAMGAGKSRILCEKAWSVAQRYPGITVGLFRKVASSIHATTLRTFERDVVELNKLAKRNKSEGWFELRNGSRIYFMGLDPDPLTGVPSKVGSLELAWAGVDEAVELTEGDWIMLLGRLRDPRIPWHQIAAATNPGPPTHWLKLRFTPPDERHQYIHTTALDNKFLPADYQFAIASLPDNAIGRRLGRGEWAALEGVIWQLPPDQVRPIAAPPKRVVAGLDWGYVHAFAVEVVGRTGTGRLAVMGELYVSGAGVDQLIEPLAALAELHGIQEFRCDPSEPGLMAELTRGLMRHRDGVDINPTHREVCKLRTLFPQVLTANNDVMPGLQSVDKRLRDGMTVDPSCSGLLGEIPGYTWAPQRGGVGFKEKPIDIGDDACDALRYAVMAFEADPSNPWAGLTSAGGVA